MDPEVRKGVQILEMEVDESDLYPNGIYYEVRMILPEISGPHVVTTGKLREAIKRANLFMAQGIVG
jgi:hypothetical protein